MSKGRSARRKQAGRLAKQAKDRKSKPRSALFNYVMVRLGVPLAFVALGIGLMLGTQFWYGVVFIYLGLILLGRDIVYEPFFNKLTIWIKITLGVFYVLGILVVSQLWIFRSAPFEVMASSDLQQYGLGTVINGIPWEANQSDLRFSIKNPTGMDYDGFDAEVSTDLTITALRQLRGLSVCGIQSSNQAPEVHSQLMIGGQPVGPADSRPEKYKIIPIDKDGRPIFNKFYRIRCEKVPAKSEFDFFGTQGNATGAPRAANWISVTAKFQTSGRNRVEIVSRCKIGVTCITDSQQKNSPK